MALGYIVSMFRSCILLLLVSGLSQTQPHRLLNYLQESFSGPGIPAGWTTNQIIGPTAAWSVVGMGTNPPVAPFGPPGQAKFNSYDAGPNQQARLTSPAVDLSGSVDPFLELYFNHDTDFPSAYDSIHIEATSGDSIAGPWIALAGFRRFSAVAGWEKIALSLYDYVGTSRAFLSIRGTSRYGNNMYIDEVRIADSAFHDLRAVQFLSPGSRFARSTAEAASGRYPAQSGNIQSSIIVAQGVSPVLVIVQNVGTFVELEYQLGWELDNEIQVPVAVNDTLERDEFDTLSLAIPGLPPGEHSLAVWVEVVGDQNEENDSLRTTIFFQDTTVLFFEGFNTLIFPPIGWTTINRDEGSLGPWFGGSSISPFPAFEREGFAANNFQRANGMYLDDYLISLTMPGVLNPGTEDSLVFWTRSAYNPPPYINYPDSLMVLLSTTGTDTSSFTTMLDYFAVPKGEWSRKAYRLTGAVPNNMNLNVAFRYLHYAGGVNGTNSDFIGIDAFHIKQSPPLAVRNDQTVVSAIKLEQNFPNPFNPATTISFETRGKEYVSLGVFTILGEKIANLVNHELKSGKHKVEFIGRDLPSGMYFYRLSTPSGTITKSMLLLK